VIDLDDLNAIASLDSEDVLGAVERFPDQCREAWEIGRSATGLPNADGVESVLVLGMGGSGVSGDVVQAVLEPRLPVPIRVIKSYGPLPEWVGRNTLVFAVSYSGSTEETIAAVEDAHGRGCRVVTISSGGPLQEMAVRDGFAHVAIPPGLQPRASLGYLTLPIFGVLVRVGLAPDLQDDIDETVDTLSDLASKCHRKRSRVENPAKDLALKLAGKVAIVYGGFPIGATAAYRFKCDINEYGKAPAFAHFFPELNHNEIVGWNTLDSVTKENFVLVLLHDPQDHERVKIRFEVTTALIRDDFAEVVELEAEGTSALARLLSLVFVTQMAAIYLGLANGVDPGPVAAIMSLKKQLSER
jgi:glucose/mannose-6-phosphate isomerase